MTDDLSALVVSAAKALNTAVAHDENTGGLLSRQLIRKSDELRIAIARLERAQKSENAP